MKGTPAEKPTFKELLGSALEHGIMDAAQVMALVKLPDEAAKRLKALERLELDASTKSKATVRLTELATVLRVKYGYSLDVELAAEALYHLTRVFGDRYDVSAYYWPTENPVVFVLDESRGVALVVAPRVE